MKTLKSEPMVQTVPIDTPPRAQATGGSTETVVLTTGKTVIMREMRAKDLLVMEQQGKRKGLGDIEMSFRLMERLSVEPGKITKTEIEALSVKDLNTLSKLLAKMGATGDDLEDDEGNENDSW